MTKKIVFLTIFLLVFLFSIQAQEEVKQKEIIFSENFDAGYPPADWSEAFAQFADPVYITPPYFSAWYEYGFANIGTTGSVKISFFDNRIDWSITPLIDLEDKNCNLEFDLALTKPDENTLGTFSDKQGYEDKFIVVISEGGTDWVTDNAVLTYTHTHTFSLNEHVTVDLSEYSGEIKIAFYVEHWDSNSDCDVFIDNVVVSEKEEIDLSVTNANPQGLFYNNNWFLGKPQATIKNWGLEEQTEYSVLFNITNANTGEEVFSENVQVSTPLQSGETTTVTTTTNWEPSEGIYTVSATVNADGDINPNNNLFETETTQSLWGLEPDAIPLNAQIYNSSSVEYSGVYGNLLFTIAGRQGYVYTQKVFIYNIDTKTWAQTTDLPVGSCIGAATCFDDNIFVHIGQDENDNASNKCYKYSIETEDWTQIADLPSNLVWTTATTVNGSVYLAGGVDYDTGPQAIVYRYDPNTDTWTTLDDEMPESILGGSLININDKLVYVWGAQVEGISGKIYIGTIADGSPNEVLWEISPTACPDLGAYKISASAISDHTLIVTGGDINNGWQTRPNTYLYNITSDTWERVFDKPWKTQAYASGVFRNDNNAYYYVTAGVDGKTYIETLEYYQINFNKPIVKIYNPTIDETNVELDAVVSVKFDKNVSQLNTPDITITDGTNNINVTDINFDNSTNTLTISHDLLEYNKTYTVIISENSFMDITGEANNEISWSFTTKQAVSIPSTNYEAISIYPNPTNGIINLEFADNNVQQIKISDLTGKTIIEKVNIQQNETIDLSSYESGIYIIKIQTDNKIFTTKIMKK